MGRIGVLLALFGWGMLASCGWLVAAPVRISWPANPATNIAGYIVYANSNAAWSVGLATQVVLCLPTGTNRVAVTAVNTDGLESLPSDWLPVVVEPPVQEVRLSAVLYHSEGVNGDFVPWRTSFLWSVSAPIKTTFYRVALQADSVSSFVPCPTNALRLPVAKRGLRPWPPRP